MAIKLIPYIRDQIGLIILNSHTVAGQVKTLDIG